MNGSDQSEESVREAINNEELVVRDNREEDKSRRRRAYPVTGSEEGLLCDTTAREI